MPSVPAMVYLRTTDPKTGSPIEIENAVAIDVCGIIYIKGVEDLQDAILSFIAALLTSDRFNQAIANYLDSDGPNRYPEEGLEFCYELL